MSKPKEIVPEEFEKMKEDVLQDSGEELEDWMDEEVGEYGNKEVNIDRVTMKAVARRSTYVKILRFLLKNKSRDFSRKEITNAVEMYQTTVHRNLVRLVEAKVLERIVPSSIDKRFKCYRIANLKVVESIIRLHDQFVGFKLAKLLPYKSYHTINELKENPEFLELCKKFKLEPDEGIEALKLNKRKVEPVYSGTYGDGNKLVGFRRKEQ